MDVRETWHFPKTKEAGGKPNDEGVETCVERRADNLGMALVEEVSFTDSPPRPGNLAGLGRDRIRASGSIRVVGAIGIFFCSTFRLPSEHRAIATDGVYLKDGLVTRTKFNPPKTYGSMVLREISIDHNIAVPGKRFRSKPFDGIKRE